MIRSNEFGMIRNEAVLSGSRGGTEETKKHPQSGMPVSGPRFGPGTSRT